MTEVERRPLVPVVAILASIVVLAAVIWTQFLAPVGAYRRTIEVPIPSELTDKLWGTKATMELHSVDGTTASVRTWAVSSEDQLRIRGFTGRRRGVTYTTLRVNWPDGRTETANVDIRL